MNHPLQLGITVLVNMCLCAAAGVALDRGAMSWFWGLFFVSLFIFAFAIMTPSVAAHRRYRRSY